MGAYMLRRIGYMLITLLGISVIAFVIIQLPPGDYLTTYITQLASTGNVVDQSIIASLERQYGLISHCTFSISNGWVVS